MITFLIIIFTVPVLLFAASYVSTMAEITKQIRDECAEQDRKDSEPYSDDNAVRSNS